MNKIPINIWVNEQRYQRLCQAGLKDMAKEVLAGMKVLQVFCSEEQKNKLLRQYPKAKYDQSTTKSIELLLVELKNKIFDKIIEKKNLNVLQEVI